MTPAFVRDLFERHSKKIEGRRFDADPEPMTDFGGFDRRAPVETCFGVLDAIKTDPNVAPEFAAALPDPRVAFMVAVSDSRGPIRDQPPMTFECLTGAEQYADLWREDGLRAEVVAVDEPYIGSKQEYYDDIRREFIESERDGDSDVRDDE